MTLNHFFYDQLMTQLPKKWLSHYVGRLSHLQAPSRLNQNIIKAFAQYYKIDCDEAEKALSEYSSLGEFFSRKLKSGARPIEADVVHPCDSAIVSSGLIHEELLIQAKGKTFKLGEFVPENPWFDDFKAGSFFTYYLAPHNYHRVHSPFKASVQWSTVVPGELWPVNSWSVKNIDRLYSVNERVAVGLSSPKGKAILVMVGATNVGSMSFSFDPNIRTNYLQKKEVVHRAYSDDRQLLAGEELGVFHLGSTVVLLYDQSWGFSYRPNKEVRMGEKF